MINNKKLLILALSTLIMVGCGTGGGSTSSEGSSINSESYSSVVEESEESIESSESSEVSSESSQSSEESSEAITHCKVSGVIIDAFGTVLQNASVTIGETSVQTNETGEFEIDNVSVEEELLTISKLGYEDKTVAISSLLTQETVSLGEIDLVKNFSKLGAIEVKTDTTKWPLQEKFVVKVSRSKAGLVVRLESDNKVFTTSEGRQSRVEIYVSSNAVSSTQDANVHRVNVSNDLSLQDTNLGGGVVQTASTVINVGDATKDVIDVTIPWSSLNATVNDIVGVSCGIWCETYLDWAPMLSLESSTVAAVESPQNYVRCDKYNLCFNSTVNDYPVQPEYNKEELTTGYPYTVADPTKNRNANADDVYVKVLSTSTGFLFEMVGFGTFTDTEYLKLVLHTSETDGVGWVTQTSDVTFLISKTKASKKTGLTKFWDYTNFVSDETSANNVPSYEENELGYFTLSFKVDFTEIPEYTSTGEVSFMMLEFENGGIYEGNPYTHGMLKNGEGVGDPANQSSYQVIQEKYIAADKDALTSGYDIEFAKSADHIYAKVDRSDDSLTLNLISFSKLDDTDFIRFVVSSSDTLTTAGWALNDTDVSFVIKKNIAYATTQIASRSTRNDHFWYGERNTIPFVDDTSVETLYTPTYTEYEEYWTLSLQIDYTEIAASGVVKDTELRAILIEFANGIIVNNSGDHTQNGTAIGDVALQNNYFVI